MTLRELSYEYKEHADALALRIRQLRQWARETEDPVQRGALERRVAAMSEIARGAGVTGMIALDANHDAIKPAFIMTFWQGQPALLEKRPTVQL